MKMARRPPTRKKKWKESRTRAVVSPPPTKVDKVKVAVNRKIVMSKTNLIIMMTAIKVKVTRKSRAMIKKMIEYRKTY